MSLYALIRKKYIDKYIKYVINEFVCFNKTVILVLLIRNIYY